MEDAPLFPRSVALLIAGLIAGAAGLPPLPAVAAPPQLALPVACQPGSSCWIVNYVDLDPGDGVRDYTCGIATYNTGSHNAHNGTDFAIRDLAAMREGVPVLAAAAGRVAGVRDGMADVSVRDTGAAAVANRECGNGVRIDHGDGWASQYCHMRSGSIAVAKGQAVTAGQPLGLVGLSGLTEFPHLHFQVDKDGVPTDPFIGAARTSARECGPGEHQLWNRQTLAALPYRTGILYNAGFAAEAPNPDEARDGRYLGFAAGTDAPALVLWADAFNVRKGDRIVLRIEGPDGAEILTRDFQIDKDQARRFFYAGTKRKDAAWQPGIYRGEARMLREESKVVSELEARAEIR